MKSITLPSGNKLDITVSDFHISKELYQVVCDELRAVRVQSKDEVFNTLKDSVCVLLSSKRVESALNECMKKAAYNGRRIDDETWEPVKAREDYLEVCYEVAKENLLPFGKPLMQRFGGLYEKVKESLV